MSCEKFGWLTIPITTSTTQQIVPKCYGFFLENKGDVDVQVNGKVLKPYPAGHPELSGQAFGYSDEQGRELTDPFQIVFTAGGSAPKLEITMVFKK